MDGVPRQVPQNPINRYSAQSPAPYQRSSVSSPLQAENGEAIPAQLPVPPQSYPQYYVPNIPPRFVMPSPNQPNPVTTPQYSPFSYSPFYGDSTFDPHAVHSAISTTPLAAEANGSSQVPEWQPDYLVRNCPICNSFFTFFNRRHHCRKCGRVVCAPCSNFKILLPSSAVVRNPAEAPSSTPASQGLDNSTFGFLGGNGRSSTFPNDQLSFSSGVDPDGNQHSRVAGFIPDVVGVSSGVEEVRACHDCKVASDQEFFNSGTTGMYTQWNQPAMLTASQPLAEPNPWVSPPMSVDISGGADGSSRRRRQSIQGGRSFPFTYNPEAPSQAQTASFREHQNISIWPTNLNTSVVNTQPPPPSSQTHSLAQYAFQQPSFPSNPALGTSRASSHPQVAAAIPNMPLSVPSSMTPVSAFDAYQQSLRRLEQSAASFGRNQHSTPQPSVQATPQVAPALKPNDVKETDFCPICTRRLPPPHPETGDEAEREEHIQECIRAMETSVSPQRAQTRQPTVSGADSSPDSGGISAVDHWRAGSGRGGRMVVYQATENDTWDFGGDSDDDNVIQKNGSSKVSYVKESDTFISGQHVGQGKKKPERVRRKAECVICFEEFEVGRAVARLECLCRYHETCIRAWFDRKGKGECPVHAVGE